jgi:thermitase
MKKNNRHALHIFFCLLLILSLATPSLAQVTTLPHEHSDQEFLVKFKPGLPAETRRAINKANNVEEKDFIPGINIHVLSAPRGKSAQAMIQMYQKNPNIDFAEPNYIAHVQLTPNDPYFNNWQKGLQRMDAHLAWDITTGSSDIIIAVLDTGVIPNHEDLANKLTPGYNFINNTTNPTDDHGHGTRVAGIIGAIGNNGIGVAGTAWQSPLMPVKVMDSNGSGSHSNIAKGIIYAADNGASVINMSLGGASGSSTLKSAVDYAYNRNVVLVAAAGNSNTSVFYPAAYPNVIAVAALDNYDQKASYSCFGPEISVSAPGNGIFSTVRTGGYDVGTGTSFAAPFVAGLAGLILSSDASLSPAKVQALIEKGATDMAAPGWDPETGYGRINMAKSLQLMGNQSSVPNEPITDPEPEPLPSEEPPLAEETPPAEEPPAEEPAVPEPSEPQPTTINFSGSLGDRRVGYEATHSFTVTNSGTLASNLSWTVRKTDFDLYLYGPNGALIAASNSSTDRSLSEQISAIVNPGEYYLKVVAVSGKGSYSLTVTLP